MPNITVKNIPPEIYERLKQSAASSHRSINSEIIACIEGAVCAQPINPASVLLTARKLRARVAPHTITDEELTRAKNKGRP